MKIRTGTMCTAVGALLCTLSLVAMPLVGSGVATETLPQLTAAAKGDRQALTDPIVYIVSFSLVSDARVSKTISRTAESDAGGEIATLEGPDIHVEMIRPDSPHYAAAARAHSDKQDRKSDSGLVALVERIASEHAPIKAIIAKRWPRRDEMFYRIVPTPVVARSD